MLIDIKTKNLKLTDSLKNFIEKRMSSIKKLVNVLGDDSFAKKGKTLAEIFWEVEEETRRHRKGNIFKVEAEIILPGKKLFAKAQNQDLKLAITEVREELERELRKYKTRTIEMPRRKYRKLKREIL